MEEEHAVFVRSDCLSPVRVAFAYRPLGPIASAILLSGPHFRGAQARARDPHLRGFSQLSHDRRCRAAHQRLGV